MLITVSPVVDMYPYTSNDNVHRAYDLKGKKIVCTYKVSIFICLTTYY